MDFIPHSKAEKILKAGGQDIVQAYKAMLKKLENAVIKYYKGDMDRGLLERFIYREVLLARQMRTAIIEANFPRVAAEKYTDILYRAERMTAARAGVSKVGIISGVQSEAAAVGENIARSIDVSETLARQSAAELNRVPRILSAIDGSQEKLFGAMRNELSKGLRHSLNIQFYQGETLINTAQHSALVSTHAEDLKAAYGVTQEKIIEVWEYGPEYRKEPRMHHIDLENCGPDENGYFYSSESFAYTMAPREWNDDLENYGCKCGLKMVWSDEITRVSTASGILTIPAGSYLLFIAA